MKRRKILLLGSGGISIGQAGEFDYSGNQAIKALIESGFDVILVNPNIATVQTNPAPHLTVYLYPVTATWVEKIIAKEHPDGIVGGFGGQTALGCIIELADQGILEKHQVKNLGTAVDILKMTEDRDLFSAKMRDLGIPVPRGRACENVDQALNAGREIGYPVIMRCAYALGGLGSGFADSETELAALAQQAFKNTPQVLVEKSIRGWKEVEYEVMRDSAGNTIAICNMENFDPLGIHTGDSIVVAPSQSLNDEDFQMLRSAALRIVNELDICGECNVQFALDPQSHNYFVIEVNARLSRSSALASKATGYPIAFIAAKVVSGQLLPDITNPVTQKTCAFYEPAMDYLAIKFPRWDLQKFNGVSRTLDSTMKSVGEIMAVGRSFPEAIQKAVRMVSENSVGLHEQPLLPTTTGEFEPTDQRLLVIFEALRGGTTVEELYLRTSIDPWFLSQLHKIIQVEREIRQFAESYPTPSTVIGAISSNLFWTWKRSGFCDEQIAYLICQGLGLEINEGQRQQMSLDVRRARQALGCQPVAKKIDTSAAEFPTETNYMYLTYLGHENEADRLDNPAILVLGGGSYRIGASVEFDWCAVGCSSNLQRHGYRSVMVNCNPETVSTDYNMSDRLYFEELSLESILTIAEFEGTKSVVVSVGGQTPNRLAKPLVEIAGLELLGHSAAAIDSAEDRSKFSAILDELNIDQPKWSVSSSRSEIDQFVEKVGFPILVRPSYVLSGAAMKIAYDRSSLDAFLKTATTVSRGQPVVVSKYFTGHREIEVDGIGRNGETVISIVSEHIENAGIHSGDATTVIPAQKLYVETIRRIKHATRAIVRKLKLNGPFNIQYLAKDNDIKVIECNARAARSFPYVSKVTGIDLISVATDIILNKNFQYTHWNEDELPHVGVKASMFSFARLPGADPILGVEMASTGEVGCIGESFEEALLLALEASHVTAPNKGILVSTGPEREKMKFLESGSAIHRMGLRLFATPGTYRFLIDHGIPCKLANWPDEGHPTTIDLIKSGTVDLVLNIPKNLQVQELTRGAQIRQAAVSFGCSLITNMEKITAFIKALEKTKAQLATHEPKALPSYRDARSPDRGLRRDHAALAIAKALPKGK